MYQKLLDIVYVEKQINCINNVFKIIGINTINYLCDEDSGSSRGAAWSLPEHIDGLLRRLLAFTSFSRRCISSLMATLISQTGNKVVIGPLLTYLFTLFIYK